MENKKSLFEALPITVFLNRLESQKSDEGFNFRSTNFAQNDVKEVAQFFKLESC
jgi:hypothetical protein